MARSAHSASKPKKPTPESAGLLLFRVRSGLTEFFLAHPGGPFWKNKDAGAWTIPKGLISEGEDPLAAACREFTEETGITPHGPYLPLGSIRQKAGKVIHAWAWEGDADPTTVQSNTTRLQFPPRSGKWIIVPEVDRCDWFSYQEACEKINPAQVTLLERLRSILAAPGSAELVDGH